jgi:hypothetical protein
MVHNLLSIKKYTYNTVGLRRISFFSEIRSLRSVTTFLAQTPPPPPTKKMPLRRSPYRLVEAKGFKPKLNVMDNQATKHIKQFLTKNECKLQLVEPHNHRVNAAERAIQTFKDAFIAALATTDSDFPLQLWDKITPQVQDTLNMMRASRVDPTKLAYEILNGPYDWNRYLLAPLGCKAVIYEDGDTRGSWASQGVGGWYLGPSKDHYRCSSLRRERTEYLGRPNCSPNIARYRV